MKKVLFALTVFFLLPFITVMAKEKEPVTLYLFYSETCPHCKAEKVYLNEIKNKYDNLEIVMYEVNDKANYDLFEKVKKQLKADKPYVPFTLVSDEYFFGYSDSHEKTIDNLINKYSETKQRDIVYEVQNNIKPQKIKKVQTNEYDIPLIGKVNALDVSLPLIAAVIGFVDGFNPCAMWILLFMISVLINLKERKKLIILGSLFIFTSGFIYMLIMLSWLKIAVTMTSIVWIRSIIALFATFSGSYYVYDYIKTRNDDGCHVVDKKKRKKIITRIQNFINQKSFMLAVVGVILLAVSVNVIELACSAGLPVVFTSILAINKLTAIQYIIYVLIYILFFLSINITIFLIAVFSFKLTSVSTKFTKYAHLISGLIMLILGLLLLIKPEWIFLNF